MPQHKENRLRQPTKIQRVRVEKSGWKLEGEKFQDAFQRDAELKHDGALALVLSHVGRRGASTHGVIHLLHRDAELGYGPVQRVEKSIEKVSEEFRIGPTRVDDEVLKQRTGAVGVRRGDGAREGGVG